MSTKTLLTPELLSHIRRIEITARRILRGIMPGGASSAQKGVGFDFDQIREYHQGDDVRFIDWSGSARTGALLVKQYKQERSRVILIAVDVSASTFFSSGVKRKSDTVSHVAAVLAFIGAYNNDRVGLLLFSQTVELYLPPRKGKEQVRMLINTLFTYKPKQKGTCFVSLFKKLAALKCHDAIVLIISDFVSELHTQQHMVYGALIARLYTVMAIRCLDKNEYRLPSVGLLSLVDIEGGNSMVVDTRNSNILAALLRERIEKQDLLFKKYRIATLDIMVDKPFMSSMVTFFKHRLYYRT